MFSRFRLAAVLLAVAVLTLAGCGNGASAPRFAPPPTGSYSNASLSGSFAFSVSGSNQFGFFALAGSLQADGNGNITSGVEDVNSGAGVFTNVPLTGTYSVTADGRGLATLNSSVGVFTIDFVIISSTRALAARFDVNSSASGSFDKQDSTAFSTAGITGQYAFSLSGIGGNGGTSQAAGLFTASGGVISSGVEDFNSQGTVTTAVPISGVYTISGANGRGTLSISSSSSTFSFAVYVVDATHIKLIETDSLPALSGDAFRQTGPFSNASVSGPFAFTVGGGLTGPLVAGGVFTASGGTITSGVEDINNSGSTVQAATTTGTYTVAANGRGTMVLSNSAGTFNYSIYPSSGGLLMMGLDTTPQSGTAYLQSGLISGTPVASITGNYGFNLTGVTNAGQLDAIARLVADGNGQFNGALDINITGNLSRSLAFKGPYTLGSNGRGTATLTSSAGKHNLAIYFVNNSRILFIDMDSDLVGVGEFGLQQ